MGAEKLSIVTKTSKEEAKEFIERFFQKYNTINALQENFLEKARKEGFAETLFGRRRYLPDINKKGLLRNLSEGAAINTPIQGSAAEIIKLSMISIDHILREKKIRSWTRPILITSRNPIIISRPEISWKLADLTL